MCPLRLIFIPRINIIINKKVKSLTRSLRLVSATTLKFIKVIVVLIVEVVNEADFYATFLKKDKINVTNTFSLSYLILFSSTLHLK